MAIFLQFVVGLIFGFGLMLSGMSNPAKVLNFLDLGGIASGSWDPSLAFVMAGGVLVTFVGYRLVLARSRPFFAERFHLPTQRELDLRIVAGPAIFRDFCRLPTGSCAITAVLCREISPADPA